MLDAMIIIPRIELSHKYTQWIGLLCYQRNSKVITWLRGWEGLPTPPVPPATRTTLEEEGEQVSEVLASATPVEEYCLACSSLTA